MSGPRDRLLATCGRDLWGLAQRGRPGGEEAWVSLGAAHWPTGGGGDLSLVGRLGVLRQRGNAALLGNRVPALPEARVGGII